MRWNIPNILTAARLALLPLVVWLIWPGIECPAYAYWAGIVYAIAGSLDMVDGAIARRTNQVTALGKFLDPLADKLFYLITLIALLQLPGNWVPGWVVMVTLARELTITGLRGIAVAEGITIAAGEGGKVKTTFATVGICGLLIHYPYMIHTGFGTYLMDTHNLGLIITYVSVTFSISSALGYIRGYLDALKSAPVSAA